MKRPEMVALGAILAVVAVTLRPYFDLTGGDFPFYLQAKSFAELRTGIEIPTAATELPTMLAMKDGRYFAQYPPGTALLLVPFYWIGHGMDVVSGHLLGEQAIGPWREGWFAIIAVTLANLVFLAGILLSLQRLSLTLGLSTRAFLHGACLTVFAAPFWYLAGHPNTHLASTMLTLGSTALIFEARSDGSATKLIFAGLAAALALFVRPLDVLALAPLGIYLLATFPRPLSSARTFGLVTFLGPVVGLLLNAAMFGSPFETAYQHSLEFGETGRQQAILTRPTSGFTTPFFEGLMGLTIGAVSEGRHTERGVEQSAVLPGLMTPWRRVRGFVFLMPVIFFAIPGFGLWRKQGRGAESLVIASQLVLLLFAYAKWFFWYANPSTPLPSRFLCDAYPGWCLAIAAYAESAERRGRAAVRFATLWSVGNQVLVTASLYLRFLSGADPAAWPAAVILVLLAATSLIGSWVLRERSLRGRSEALPQDLL